MPEVLTDPVLLQVLAYVATAAISAILARFHVQRQTMLDVQKKTDGTMQSAGIALHAAENLILKQLDGQPVTPAEIQEIATAVKQGITILEGR